MCRVNANPHMNVSCFYSETYKPPFDHSFHNQQPQKGPARTLDWDSKFQWSEMADFRSPNTPETTAPVPSLHTKAIKPVNINNVKIRIFPFKYLFIGQYISISTYFITIKVQIVPKLRGIRGCPQESPDRMRQFFNTNSLAFFQSVKKKGTKKVGIRVLGEFNLKKKLKH